MNHIIQLDKVRIIIEQGNIINTTCETVVNTANMWLKDGGGVTGAIFSACGKPFADESAKIGFCPPGSAVLVPVPPIPVAPYVREVRLPGTESIGEFQRVSPPKKQPAWKHVIHCVGAPYEPTRIPQMEAMYRSLQMQAFSICETYQIPSLAMPSMGTGIYQCPLVWSAYLTAEAIEQSEDTFNHLKEVHIVLFDVNDFHVYRSVFLEVLEGK